MRPERRNLFIVLAATTVAVGVVAIWGRSAGVNDELFNQMEAKVHQAVEAEGGSYPVVNLTELVKPFISEGTPLADAGVILEELGFSLVEAPKATQPGFDARYTAGRYSRRYNLFISNYRYVIVLDIKDDAVGVVFARAAHTSL